METLDNEFQLYIEISPNNKILVNEELLQKININDFSSFPEGVEVLRTYPSLYEINFQSGNNMTIFCIPVKCELSISGIPKEIFVYSFKHLKLILAQLKKEYKNPFFYSSFYKADVYINDNKDIDERNFSFERTIEIKNEKEEAHQKEIRQIFEGIEKIYSKVQKTYTYEFISPNFNKYFPNINPGNPSDNFNFCYSDERKDLESKFILFLKDKDEMIYPISGPHNIGKTITALIIQKTSFKQGIKSLYLNLKYYFDKPQDNLYVKINTLIKECFFFVDNDAELLSLYNKFRKLIQINDMIKILFEFFNSKSYNSNKFFIIIDQFQEKYNSGILNQFSKYKIFLLSSINDFDVKKNLIYIYAEKSKIKYKLAEQNKPNKIIKYIYYQELFDKIKFFKLFENNIRDKIKNENEGITEVDFQKKFDFINNILHQFNYIPKYFFGYIYYYQTIHDLMFNEYGNIFKKLLQFEQNKTIDIKIVTQLSKNNYIMEKGKDGLNQNYKTLQVEEYVEYLKYIPLKYINYHINEKGEIFFYYSFPFFKHVLDDFIDYNQSNENFMISKDGGKRGTNFETILKYQFKVFKKLDINAHIEVGSIVEMNFTENYKSFEENYKKGTKNILITQKNRIGQDYDFAIYMTNLNQLLLIQSKYQIDYSLIKHKVKYINSSKEALKNFNISFNENINKVYLLYISSEEYNIDRKKTVKNILDNYKINCLFYSVSRGVFSFDFENLIRNLECDDSFMILPEIKPYKSQNIKFEFENKEKQKNTKDNNRNLLGKKINKIYDEGKIYEELKNYLEKNLNISLGEMEEMGYIINDFNKEVGKKSFIAIFSLKTDDESSIDFESPIGVNYIEKKKDINLEVTKKKYYSKFEELFNSFSNKIYYVIGKTLAMKKLKEQE